MALVDVLIPTYHRPAALAVTLAGLVGQTFTDFRVVVSDQSEDYDAQDFPEVRTALRALTAQGGTVELHKHLPRRGMAEHRQSLLDRATAAHALFIDDDILLAPYVLGLLHRVITEQGCGFVGNAVIGLSYLDDVRPQEQGVELWHGHVQPERVTPQGPGWQRYRLHNAANLYHVQERLEATPASPVVYKVAWVGGCVMYEVAALRACGGFEFWRDLPHEHAGEDVLAQLRVMERFGGCGVMPSGAYHQELPTTIVDRTYDAPRLLA